MNYSEGPWYVDVQTDNTIVEGRYQTVADKVSNRDADLIAAAPDLYEALKRVIGGRDWGNVEDHEYNCMCLYHEAIKALNKAEGRNND